MSTSILRGAVALAVALLLCFVAAGTASATNADNRLLQTYQPVTYLDPLERFRSASIQSFVTDSRGRYLRLGPAPYHSDEQLETAVEELGRVARG